MKWFRFLFVFSCVTFALNAANSISVAQLVDMVRSSLALKYEDGKIAKYVKSYTLTDRLDDKIIEDLEQQGAGPKTLKALHELRDESANLKGPTTTKPQAPITGSPGASMSEIRQPPPPDSVRQHEILEAMKNYATSYTQSLPNFLCVQDTTRYVSFNGGDSFRREDRILTRLSFNNGQEDYKVYQIGDQMVDTELDKLGGAISSGEFGSLMKSIFSPRSQAQFGWDHWGRLRGKIVAVFNYSIDSAHSDYTLDYGRGAQRIVTAYRGKIYTDENTGVITRLTFQAVDVPESFPIQMAETVLDYDDQEIGENKYVLPLRAQITMAGPHNVHTRNDEVFKLYRKFGTESTIKFSDVTAEPPPPDKTAEQPVEDPVMKGLPPPPPK